VVAVAMTTLRATAIMKTDISGSTARFRALLEPDLNLLLTKHHQLISRVAARHDLPAGLTWTDQ
jgi:adenylate cyclase